MISVTGVLVDPMNQPSAETIVRVTAKNNSGSIMGLVGEITTGSDGSYDFNLVDGTHDIEIHFKDEYILTGTVEVDGNTPSPITLPELLGNTVV